MADFPQVNDRLSEAALRLLWKEYRRGTEETKLSVLNALKNVASCSVLPVLVEALVDEAKEVRVQAAIIYLSINAPDKVPFKIRALQHQDIRVRNEARSALARQPEMREELAPEIEKLLEHNDPGVRESAALVLGDLNTEEGQVGRVS